MVLTLEGNSEIGTHVWSGIGDLISLRHLFISRAFAYLKFISAKCCFLCKVATCLELPSNISTTCKPIHAYYILYTQEKSTYIKEEKGNHREKVSLWEKEREKVRERERLMKIIFWDTERERGNEERDRERVVESGKKRS